MVLFLLLLLDHLGFFLDLNCFCQGSRSVRTAWSCVFILLVLLGGPALPWCPVADVSWCAVDVTGTLLLFQGTLYNKHIASGKLMSWYWCVLYMTHPQSAVFSPCSHVPPRCSVYPALPIAAAAPEGPGHHPAAGAGTQARSLFSFSPLQGWLDAFRLCRLAWLARPFSSLSGLCGTAHSSFPPAMVFCPRNPAVNRAQPRSFAGDLLHGGASWPWVTISTEVFCRITLRYPLLLQIFLLSLHPVVQDEASWGDSLM